MLPYLPYFVAILLLFGSGLAAGRSYCDNFCYCDSKYHWICRVPKSTFQSIDLDQLPSGLRKLELINLQLKKTDRLLRFRNLIELRLRNVGLNELPRSFLQMHLLSLDVSNNNLKKLTNTMLQMPLLEQLDLSKNQLTSIDHQFDHLSSLKQLNLSSNLISRLSESSFRNLTKLQYLNLKSNRIHQIELGTFYQLHNLVKLVLDNNMRLDHLKLDLFELRMRSLHLSQTNLTSIPQSINEHIRELYLDRNLLERLTIGDFEHLTNLRSLHLEHNQLREIEFDTFGRMSYLVELYLSSNHLLQVPEQLPPKSLRVLSLSDNLITELNCTYLKHLLQLDTLDLSTNHIQALDTGCFSSFINIQHLDLSENQLTTVDEQFSNLKQLQSLNLSGNELIRLSARSWLGLENLKQLELSFINGRRMSCFDDVYIFHQLPQLQVLNLTASPFLVNCLIDYHHLSELKSDLSDSSDLMTNHQRKHQNLKENQREYQKMNHIENPMKRIDFNEIVFPNLETLIAKDVNILGKLNLTRLQIILPQLVILDLQNSSFNCDLVTLKQITNLINESVESSIQLVNLDEWTCAQPKRVRNRKIVDIIFTNQTSNHHFKRLFIESTNIEKLRKLNALIDYTQPKAHQLVNLKHQIKWSKLMSSDAESQFVNNQSFLFFNTSNYSTLVNVFAYTLVGLFIAILTHQIARRLKFRSKFSSFIRSYNANPLANKSKRFKHVNYSKQHDDVFIITQCSSSDFQSSSEEPLLNH